MISVTNIFWTFIYIHVISMSIYLYNQGVVLDPALYLAPSPPLTPSKDIDEKKLWSMPPNTLITSTANLAEFYEKSSTTSIKPESLEVAETFWPSYRSSGLKGIYFPLSIHLSGTYGGGSSGSSVYSSSYIDMANAYDNLAKAVRPGINYSPLGGHTSLRIFGSNNRPSWGGWGNGRWGHYGKG
ncbi:uncharacterized protein LOC123661842 [Melitaea cinxia]|uniref:uncharacterized protein LOC123661842 n=1 Tax=Melitaea cinxia TaxID=113334 RepID=UPI001E26EB10|nr:uncharacterized protein LOC123661842 [Melitaea cinxia]